MLYRCVSKYVRSTKCVTAENKYLGSWCWPGLQEEDASGRLVQVNIDFSDSDESDENTQSEG